MMCCRLKKQGRFDIHSLIVSVPLPEVYQVCFPLKNQISSRLCTQKQAQPSDSATRSPSVSVSDLSYVTSRDYDEQAFQTRSKLPGWLVGWLAITHLRGADLIAAHACPDFAETMGQLHP